MENRTLLDSKTYKPGYITKDELWAVVSYGDEFMVLNKGKQIQVFSSLEDAKSFISKKTKTKRVRKSKSESNITQFLQ